MGHVFHPGHDALHGTTVVLDAAGARTYIGRFDREDASGVHLLDVASHDDASGGSREEFIRRSATFGVRPERKHVTVPSAEVASVVPLAQLADA